MKRDHTNYIIESYCSKNQVCFLSIDSHIEICTNKEIKMLNEQELDESMVNNLILLKAL